MLDWFKQHATQFFLGLLSLAIVGLTTTIAHLINNDATQDEKIQTEVGRNEHQYQQIEERDMMLYMQMVDERNYYRQMYEECQASRIDELTSP